VAPRLRGAQRPDSGRFSSLIARCASQMSMARWALSQNSAELPKSFARRSAIAGVTGAPPAQQFVIDWRDTPMAAASWRP